ncbi:glycosyltransferase family 4 protein [Sphingobacterium shayense]|uniref:glycosyltransferase family 4 protein n=1 Tax=Sphingobacterium shayense TaxID=626343 RepID=UPI001555019E|nr:glycosyltransferase family 4 protein [Sphingobacterium shayense]NQD72552.1 glycosyltransferase family 4 protein [Sphingobacterium shayense]
MNNVIKWKETIRALISYPYIMRKVSSIESNIVFFFPRFQTGGAERVHLNIIRSVSDKNPVCIFTDFSDNDDLLSEYRSYATTINLLRWGWKRSFRKKMAKKVAAKINKIENPILFGSNSEFFFDLFPYLKPDCVKIDLLHTDLSHLPLSIENYALPYTEQLHRRVLLGKNHQIKIKEFYHKNGIPLQELSKIEIIPNGINVPADPPAKKQYTDKMIVLFIARNSYEKRPELYLQIAREALAKNLPFEFQMIGDFEIFEKEKPNNLKIIGKITDVDELNKYYKKAHFIFITSIFEGFPMVILEGLSYGVIPITTDVGEIYEDINIETKTGFIVPNYRDQNEIINGFLTKLEEISNKEYDLQLFVNNGYSLVKSKFSESKFHENYRKLILNIN